MTSKDLPSAISSPESGPGPSRFDAPAGPTTAPCGLLAVLASLSARQAKAAGLLTSGTYGRISSTSPGSDALQRYLVSKLQASTRNLGSTLYKLTWKPWITASGRSRSRLRASVLRTYATDSTGWPTPQARDHKGANLPGNELTHNARPLNEIVRLAGWPTATASDGRQYSEKAALEWIAGATTNGHSLDLDLGVRLADAHSILDGGRPGPVNGLWRDADWLFCRDGKWRPVEPSTFPLAHGAPARVGRLRAYGNAINAEAARVFIEAGREAIDEA